MGIQSQNPEIKTLPVMVESRKPSLQQTLQKNVLWINKKEEKLPKVNKVIKRLQKQREYSDNDVYKLHYI